MKPRGALKGWLIFWIAFTLVVLLLPSPREWGALGKWLSPRYDILRPYAQPLAHFSLMAIISSLLVTAFADKKAVVAFVFSVGITMALAALFEVFQSLLPPVFGRSGDLDDLVSSLIGAAAGCALALCFRRREKSVTIRPPDKE